MNDASNEALATRSNELPTVSEATEKHLRAIRASIDRGNDKELFEHLRRMQHMGILHQAATKQAAENHLSSQKQAISVFDEAGRWLQEASHLTEEQKQWVSAELERLSQVLSTYNRVTDEALLVELVKGAQPKTETYWDKLDEAAGLILKAATLGLYKPYERRR